MQAPGGSQRMMRRSPGAEPGPPPNVPVRSISPAVGGTAVASRSSTASNRSGQSVRRSNASGGSNPPLSQIEKSVTHLLVATKQLLETLTQWSRGQATDTQVSDVYVRLGYEFNMACRAFTAINVDTSDLGNVPESLRHILEATLSQEASSESLDKYLPRIRDIIINLLHGLKRKQQKLRQKSSKEKENGTADPSTSVGRAASTSTVDSHTSGLTGMLDQGIENGFRPETREGLPGTNVSPNRRFLPQRDQSRGSVNSEQSTVSSNTLQNAPVLPPYPGDETIPTSASDLSIDSFPPPPPPPPPPKSQQSALAALQRGGDLERRASRRYSAYQISKLVGASANGVPMLPTQTTPIPNRGRGEMRESLRAVQTRENLKHIRNDSSNSKKGYEASPVRIPSKVSEEAQVAELPAGGESPVIQSQGDRFRTSATLNGPSPDVLPVPGGDEGETTPQKEEKPDVVEQPPTTSEKQGGAFVADQSPPPTKELTLFLQYKSKVKKFVLSEGYDGLSVARLQLAFIEKFSWNTQQNGADLPEIYIQDPVSGVRHELEDLSDIKDRTVLVLNIEQLDEVKRHIDDGLGTLKKLIEDVRQNVDDQGTAIQRVSDRQQEAAKEMARISSAPAPAPTPAPTPAPAVSAPVEFSKTSSPAQIRGKLSSGQAGEIQSLRRDLAVLRQTYSSFQADIQGSMTTIRSKANNVKAAAAKTSMPDTEGGEGYAYVNKGRKQLNTDSDRLVNKVDDLQDMVEDLRKDVVHRGVRPLPRQLETAAKDIQLLTMELKRMEEYMKREKPVWTKIWEKELEEVCQGRDELRLMEDLVVDLQDDLEKATETFSLVEQATKEQMKENGTGTTGAAPRQFSRGISNLSAASGVDPSEAKEGVLGEVRALQPNHEDRLEAIERAERLRQKELATRKDNALQREIRHFVDEGKLKKSGGFEEVERARKAKDDRIRREVWERQNGIIPEEPVGEDGEDGGDNAEDGAEEGAEVEEPEDKEAQSGTEEAP